MRIDQFLWCIRYFKTRNLSTKACKNGHVKINNKNIKPSKEIFPSDTILIRKNQINYSVEVLEIPKSRISPKLLYQYIIDKTNDDEFINKKLNSINTNLKIKNAKGRPTKKNRRDIKNFLENKKKWFYLYYENTE